ncbi:17545_t:CDS:2, partial [Acaulospora morrowiae]
MGKVNSKPCNNTLDVPKMYASAKTLTPRSSTSDLSYMSDCSSSCDLPVGAARLYCLDDVSKYNECDRHHIRHFLTRDIWESNFSSPIEDMLTRGRTRILDVGCSSGTWVLEMASTYQDSKFYGVEVSPLFPTLIKPRNVKFAVANVVEGLPFSDNMFDFVHMGFMGLSLIESSWERVIEELVRVTKPGGWVEICDSDYNWINAGPRTKRLYSKVSKELFASHGVKMELSLT